MEPAYWQMRRIAQDIPFDGPAAEFERLEQSIPRRVTPVVTSDPDIPIESQDGETPLLSLECGRVVDHGGWRTLRPATA